MPRLKETGLEGQIAIDRMALEDLNEIVRLERESFSDPWPKKGFEDQLRDGSSLMLVARRQESSTGKSEIVGYLCAYHILEELQLASVAVKEPFRRRGIAHRLIAEMTRQGLRRGAKEIWLDVRKSNAAARQLYEDLGFREVYRRKNYYRRPVEDAVVMFRSAGEARPEAVSKAEGRLGG